MMYAPQTPATPEYTPEEIRRRVTQFQADHAQLHRRMDYDYDLYELRPYNANADGTNTFPSYTSNAPRTYAKKVVSLLASANLFLTVPYGPATRDERTRYDVKERFCYGLLESADERLLKKLMVRVKPQLIWYSALRGYACLRRVLVKDRRGGVYVDILPLDPRNLAWGIGAEGLEWAAYTTMVRCGEVEARYGVTLGGQKTAPYEVIDYYDRQTNAVIVAGYGFVKQPTAHGAVGVPIDIVPVSTAPEIQSPILNLQTASSGYGESIYAEDRGVYQTHNHIMSIYLSLVAKARDRSYVLYSPDGTATLKDNPNEASGVLSLPSTAKIDLVALSETTKDAAILSSVVNEEIYFGSLSKTSYGDVPFQLSGFAINSLRQSVFSILQPIVDAVSDAYNLALNGLCDQYLTGRYDTMQLSGYDNRRTYFSQHITPQEIADLPSAKVTIEPNLPQDDVGNIAMAVQARTPDAHGIPILPDVDILERIVKVQDVGATTDAIKEQEAERNSPRALAYTLMSAAENRGRPDLAAIYFGELMIQQLKQLAELYAAQIRAMMGQQAQVQAEQQIAAPATTAAPAATGAANPLIARVQQGLPPQVAPAAAQGQPPPTPTPQGGPLVPPNTPRPGAREE